MAEQVVLKTEPRTQHGSRAAEKLRKSGRIPAVVYGHKEETAAVSVVADDFIKAVRSAHTRVFDLNVGSKIEKALIRDVQYDHLGSTILHVDFFRVSADERIRVSVPIELRGIPSASSYVTDQPLHELEIECLAIAIPESIRVSLTGLQIGQSIHVKELPLPEGVKALDNPEAIVVAIKPPLAEPTPTEAAGSNEPEVLTAKKKEEEAPAADAKKK